MESFFNNERFSDCKIINDDKTYFCHRIVLVSSSFFDAMFNFGNIGDDHTIRLEGKFEHFEDILKFIYGIKLDEFVLLKIAKEADFFGLNVLKYDFLSHYLHDNESIKILKDEFFDDYLYNGIGEDDAYLEEEYRWEILDDDRILRFMNTRNFLSRFMIDRNMKDVKLRPDVKFELYYWVNYYIRINWKKHNSNNSFSSSFMEVLNLFENGRVHDKAYFIDCLKKSEFYRKYGKMVMKHGNILSLQYYPNFEFYHEILNLSPEQDYFLLKFDIKKILSE